MSVAITQSINEGTLSDPSYVLYLLYLLSGEWLFLCHTRLNEQPVSYIDKGPFLFLRCFPSRSGYNVARSTSKPYCYNMWVLLTTLLDPHLVSNNMPPSRPIFKHCKCEECIHKNSDGISMDSRLIPAHLNHVQEKSTISLTAIQKSPYDSHPDGLVGHLFALTLTDDGPDPKSSASKLWNSCTEYQESSPSSNIITGSLDPPPFSDITESLGHLSLSSPPPSSPLDNPPAVQIAGCRISKKNHCQHSRQALKLLSNIEACANWCFHLLLDPSDSSVAEVTNELMRLCPALESITQKTDFINSHKKEVTTTLDKLELEVKARLPACPSPNDPEPVNVNTGKRIFPISNEYKVIQSC